MFTLTLASGPECPQCGCRDSRILEKPDRKSWFKRFGRARCGHCGYAFVIREVSDDAESNGSKAADDEDDQDAPPAVAVSADEPTDAKMPPLCPDCGSEMKVTSTRKTVRWYRCPECKKTRKIPR